MGQTLAFSIKLLSLAGKHNRQGVELHQHQAYQGAQARPKRKPPHLRHLARSLWPSADPPHHLWFHFRGSLAARGKGR